MNVNVIARFWWAKILTWTKGGTTWCNACGPPFALEHKFKNWKACFSDEKMLVRMKGNSFVWNRMVSRNDFDEWKFWNEPKGGPQDAMHVVPPLLLTTSWNIEKLVFQMKKCLFWWKETVSSGIGWFRARFWCLVHFKIFTHQNLASKPSDSKRNCFLSWKQAFFHLKNKFFNFWNCGQEQRGDHMHCILWSPQWKFWNGPKGGPQDAMHVVPPLLLTTSSNIEKLVFQMKKCLFSWKETVSFRIGWFWGKILMSENFEMDQRGDHRMQCMWSPLCSWPQFQKLKNLFFRWKNACFHERKQFRLESDGFEARFWWVKILKWTKGGTTGCNACGPPFALEHKFKNWKTCFSDEKMLVFMKGNSFVWNRMVSSKMLISENFEMDQRGDHRMQCMWSPLCSWPQVQKLKNLFFRWKNACFHLNFHLASD